MRPSGVLVPIVCGLMLILAGCDRPFQHPTKGPGEWSDDHARCEQMVRESLRGTSDANDPMFEAKLINTCMRKKGWRKQ